jgi:hypothetical protein
MRIEEILMSGLAEGSKHFGMHWYSLGKEKKRAMKVKH